MNKNYLFLYDDLEEESDIDINGADFEEDDEEGDEDDGEKVEDDVLPGEEDSDEDE